MANVGLEWRRRESVQRKRQPDPGIRLRVGGAGDLVAIGLDRLRAPGREEEAVGLAEREVSVSEQFR